LFHVTQEKREERKKRMKKKDWMRWRLEVKEIHEKRLGGKEIGKERE
jgi:hypothetical protein